MSGAILTSRQLGSNMSQTALPGMTWPSAALHAPRASISVLPKPAILHNISTIWGNHTIPMSHMAVTMSLGTASVLHPTMSPPPFHQSQGTINRASTAITVTKSCIHNMTAVPGASGTKYPRVSQPLTTVHVTRYITQTGNPSTANTNLAKYQLRHAAPTVSRLAFTPLSNPQTSSDSSPPNHGAIVGGIIGGILAFLGLLILIKICRPHRKKSRDLEKGHSRHRHHNTHAVLDEVQRRNQKRRRSHHNRINTAAVDLAHARNWEHGFDTNRFRSAPRARPDSVSSFGMSPEELAQTHAWNEGPTMDGLYGSSRRQMPPAYPQYPVKMPTRKSVAQAGRMPSVREIGHRGGGSRRRGPIRSVSPLSIRSGGYAGRYGRGDYGDVSPIGSPNRNRLV